MYEGTQIRADGTRYATGEVQAITRTSTGGTVTFTFDGEETATVPATAAGLTAAAVQAALVALPNVAPGDVVVTGANGGPLAVTFGGAYVGEDVPELVVDNTSATGGTVTVAESSDVGPMSPERSTRVSVYGVTGKVQTITRTSTGGTFTLTYDGQETGTITAVAGVTAGAIESALEALSNLSADEVAVSGSAGGPFTVTFSFASNPRSIEALVVDDSSATGGSVSVAQQVPIWNSSSDRLEWGTPS